MGFIKGSEPFSIEKKSDIGVLISHGFTSTPASAAYIGKKFGDARFNVECPRLDGHCTKWEDLNKVSYTDWLANHEKALAKLKKRASKIFVFGLSLGGTLMLRIAQLHPEIKGIVIINHALFFGNPAIFLLPILRYILPSTPGIANDIKDPNVTELAYDRNPTNGVYNMTKLIKLVKRDLPAMTMPILIFKSKDDHVLPQKNAPYTYEKIGTPKEHKELIWLKNSYHVATMDYDKDLIAEKSIDFIKKYSAKK